jgi:hypothetical protein
VALAAGTVTTYCPKVGLIETRRGCVSTPVAPLCHRTEALSTERNAGGSAQARREQTLHLSGAARRGNPQRMIVPRRGSSSISMTRIRPSGSRAAQEWIRVPFTAGEVRNSRDPAGMFWANVIRP